MAPALNEPLSPTTTEKLTKSTVSVPTTRATRRQSALDATPTLKAASTPTGVGISREQKSRRSNTPETTTIITRRRTRSKKSLTTKLSANNKEIQQKTVVSTEPMGLTAALSTNNRSNSNNAQISSSKENQNNNKVEILEKKSNEISDPTTSSTTNEILANLTINFEEAITAEICLRKQLLDSKLNKEAVKKTNGTELKDILVIKGSSDASVATDSDCIQEEQSQHMEESVLEESVEKLDNILPPNNSNDNKNEEKLKSDEIENVNEKGDELHINAENQIEQEQVQLQLQDDEKNVTDDILEERLSELDGSLCEPTKITTTIEDELNAQLQLSSVKNAQEDLKDLHMQLQLSPSKHDELKELQAQLQLSPVKTNTQVDLQDLQAQLQLTPTAKTTDIVPTMQMQMLVDEQMGVDQQHNQESTNMPQIVGNTGDIEEEDLEEVIRALKGFDPATAGPETLCDLNAIFGEVYQNMNYEDVNTAQAVAITSSISPIKSNPLHEAQLEIDKVQQVIERKLEFLLRRLRKLQARHMCKHTSEELAGIFEYTVRTVNNTLSSSSLLGHENAANKNQSSLNPLHMSIISARPFPELWQKEREHPVPAIQVYNLMRKVETAAKAQQLCTVSSSLPNNSLIPVRKSRKSSMALEATQTTSAIEPPAAKVTENIIPALDAMAVEEITQVTGMLQSEMREVQQSIDSEATDSSSGCESADEMISYNNHIQQALPIEKRAAWRYARNRAAIAARWSWLMSHIADLEIKIRQHTELYNEIVRKKGSVIADLDSESATSTAQEEDNDRGSCRTRGYLSTHYRKRKLLQTPNIHTISKKAARPSTLKCGCQWPMQPCALCTGRPDPTAPRELPNTMVKNERVALLDSGFHPVLSLPEDVSSSLYSEAVARLSDWQQRAIRCQVKTIAKGVWKAEREASGGGLNSRKYDGSTGKRRYIKKKDRLAAEAAAAAKERESMGATSNAVTEIGLMDDKNGTESATSNTPLVANSNLLRKQTELSNTEENNNDSGSHNKGIDGNGYPLSNNERLSGTKILSLQQSDESNIEFTQEQQQISS